MAMLRGKSKYTQVLRLYHDFQKLTIEEIQEQMKDVIHKHGARVVAEGVGLSYEACCRYCKALFVRKNLKPDFVSYCKVMEFGDKKGRLSDEEE